MLKFNYLNLKYCNIFTILLFFGFILYFKEGIYYALVILFFAEIFLPILIFFTNNIIINFDDNTLSYNTFFSKKTLKFDEINYYKKTLLSYRIYSFDNKLILKISRLYTSYFKFNDFSFEKLLINNSNINIFKDDLNNIYIKKFKGDFNFLLFSTIYILLMNFDGILVYILDEWQLYDTNIVFIILTSILSLFLILLIIYKIYGFDIIKKIYCFLSFLLYFPIFILSFFSFLIVGPSTTNDFNNYLKFDRVLKERWENTLNNFFPSDITNDEVVNYHYYYRYNWDLNFEIYLEIKVNEEKFDYLIDKYKNDYDYTQVNAYYNASYIELIHRDRFDSRNIDSNYTTSSNIEKLIYNEETKTIIYEYLHSEDGFDFEDIYYFNRFNINAYEYNSYVNGEKNI